jgi:sec-independent protein translocase protein TatA
MALIRESLRSVDPIRRLLMFSQFGPLEIILVLVIVLVIFGPKRLPGLGKQLGRGMREFRESITGEDKDDDRTPPRPELTKAQADEPVPPTPVSGTPAERTPADVSREQRG